MLNAEEKLYHQVKKYYLEKESERVDLASSFGVDTSANLEIRRTRQKDTCPQFADAGYNASDQFLIFLVFAQW